MYGQSSAVPSFLGPAFGSPAAFVLPLAPEFPSLVDLRLFFVTATGLGLGDLEALDSLERDEEEEALADMKGQEILDSLPGNWLIADTRD